MGRQDRKEKATYATTQQGKTLSVCTLCYLATFKEQLWKLEDFVLITLINWIKKEFHIYHTDLLFIYLEATLLL